MVCFLNSDHVMFSREFAFCLFINYVYICMWMNMWSEMGKQNIQAKKVY